LQAAQGELLEKLKGTLYTYLLCSTVEKYSYQIQRNYANQLKMLQRATIAK